MSKPNEVKGRPAWARDEPIPIQRLIMEHRLTQQQLKVLRGYAAEPMAGRRVEHSTARALRDRGWGEITAKQMNRSLSREHPKVELRLNDTGRAMLLAVTEGAPDASPASRAG